MGSTNDGSPKWMMWVGYLMSILPCLLLFFSASMKYIKPAGFADGLAQMGWTEGQMFYLGFVEILSTVIYLIPRTSVLGAILLTAYMGGAIATHARVGDAFVAQILVGVFVWGGLFLRDPKIRELIPLNRG